MAEKKTNKSKECQERAKIVKMKLKGMTYKEIKEKTCRGMSYVQKWVNRFNKFGYCTNASRKCKPRKVSKSLRKKIINITKKNNKLSCRKIAKKLNGKTKIYQQVNRVP